MAKNFHTRLCLPPYKKKKKNVNSVITIFTTLGVGARVQARTLRIEATNSVACTCPAAHALASYYSLPLSIHASFCPCTPACHIPAAAGSRDLATEHRAVPNCYYSSSTLMWFSKTTSILLLLVRDYPVVCCPAATVALLPDRHFSTASS